MEFCFPLSFCGGHCLAFSQVMLGLRARFLGTCIEGGSTSQSKFLSQEQYTDSILFTSTVSFTHGRRHFRTLWEDFLIVPSGNMGKSVKYQIRRKSPACKEA